MSNTEDTGDHGRRPSDRIADDARHLVTEIEEWLAGDVTADIDTIVQAARPTYRRDAGCGPADQGRMVPLPWGTELGSPKRTVKHVAYCTPEDLRELADRQAELAEQFSNDAADLRAYADAIEDETGVGPRLSEHMAAMRAEVEHRQAVRDEAHAVATGPDGVLKWDGVDCNLGWLLKDAGLLTVAGVQQAMDDDRIWNVKGIGAARYRLLTRLLRDRADA
jgi:hypothetical protein